MTAKQVKAYFAGSAQGLRELTGQDLCVRRGVASVRRLSVDAAQKAISHEPTLR